MVQRLSFNEWKIVVDANVFDICGLSSDDLPDYRYHDAYMRGDSAKKTAERVVRASKKEILG